MTRKRYDRPALVQELNKIAGQDELAIITIGPQLPQTEFRILRDWGRLVVEACTAGEPPDLGDFPGLALTPDTPREDFRWKMIRRAYLELEDLGALGAVVTQKPLGSHLTALQFISDGRAPHVRLNGAVRGVFWCMARPDWMDVGWELPASEREDATHITILSGRLGHQPAALVFWNATPTIVRSASPEKLWQMQQRSIGVAGARQR